MVEMTPESEQDAHAAIWARLHARRSEMEQAILVRVWEVSSPMGAEDDEYATGLQTAVSAGVGHGLAGVEQGENRTGPPIPGAMFAHARQAARSGVALDVELRRHFAGYTLFCDFILRAADDDVPLPGAALRQALHTQATLFERLVVAVMGEYRRESGSRPRPPQRRQVQCVKRLLAGEPVDTGDLAYEIDDWHVGVVARGDGAAAAIQGFAETADCRLLLVQPERGTAWGWLGGRRRIAVAEVAQRASSLSPGRALVALGEPARAVEGWRLTHQQASAALRVAGNGAGNVVRYADVGLLASISQDHVLASSLQQLYLAPLSSGRDGGAGLRETLRAYFTAGRNISSAASALGVSRQTVGNRLRTIEERLGRTLESCAPEIEVALRLHGSGDLASTPTPPPF